MLKDRSPSLYFYNHIKYIVSTMVGWLENLIFSIEKTIITEFCQ
jgi:hypothetical protein